MLMSTLRDRFLALTTYLGREQGKLLLSVIAVASVYGLIAFAFMPPGVFWSPDSGMKYIQMQNIRWEDGLELSINYPGRDLDPEIRVPPYHDLLYRIQDGKIYPVWLPYFSLLSKLPYELFGYRGLLVVPVLSGLVAIAASYWLASLCGFGRPWGALLGAAFTTPLFVYSVLFTEHIVFTAVTALAFCALVWGEYRQALRGFMVGGALLGLSALFRSEAYVFAVAVLLAYLLQTGPRPYWRGLAGTAGAFSLLVVGMRLMNSLMFGSVLSLQEAQNTRYFSTWLTYLDRVGVGAIQDLLVGDNLRGSVGFLLLGSGAGLVLSFKAPSSAWGTAIRWACSLGYGAAAAMVFLASEQLTALHGLLAASPILLFTLMPRGHDSQEMPLARWALSTSLIYVIAVAGIVSLFTPGMSFLGALEWGPRFLLPVYPLLVPLAQAAFVRVYRTFSGRQRTLFITFGAVLLVVSMGIQVQGLRRIQNSLVLLEETRDLLHHARSEVMVTDLFWIGESVATEFYDSRTFLVNEAGLFREWLARARDQGVKEFTMVSFLPPERNPLFAGLQGGPGSLNVVDTKRVSTGLLIMRLAFRD